MNPLFILLAEDNDDHAELMIEALEDYHELNRIERAANGEELVNFLESLQLVDTTFPDLILLDLKMPRLDGFGVLSQLKSDNRLRRIPIMVVSTSDYRTDVDKAFQLGANSYITKPIHHDEFLKKMQALNEFWVRTSERPGYEDITDRR